MLTKRPHLLWPHRIWPGNSAFQKKIANKREIFGTEEQSTANITSSVSKNESTGIHTVSKEALIACIGGIANSKAQEIKARLS